MRSFEQLVSIGAVQNLPKSEALFCKTGLSGPPLPPFSASSAYSSRTPFLDSFRIGDNPPECRERHFYVQAAMRPSLRDRDCSLWGITLGPGSWAAL